MKTTPSSTRQDEKDGVLIEMLSDALREALPLLPTEDQCCDIDRDEVAALHRRIHWLLSKPNEKPPRTCEAPGERGTVCLSEPGHNGQHLFGKLAVSGRSCEIARNVARQFIQQTIHTLHSSDDTPLLVRLIEQAYAPLYEQKEELVRVLNGFCGFVRGGYAETITSESFKKTLRILVREAEAALEKAGK